MSYAELQNSITRTRIDKIIIKADYCANAFGQTPCTATGEKCYNTFPSCKDKQNYSKTTRDYEFVSGDITADLARKMFPARPYIKKANDLPTEIKETDTVIKLLKVTLLDEPDIDVGIDPYYGTRAEIKGTYWKKWLARNKNYKGRIIEQYEAYAFGDEVTEFKIKFIGRIENIKQGNGSIEIEATDLLKKLSESEYPFRTSSVLTDRLPNYFTVVGEDEMLKLPAVTDDYCAKSNFITIGGWLLLPGTGGSLTAGQYKVCVVAYDRFDRPFSRKIDTITISSNDSNFKINAGWGAVIDAEYYKIFIKQLKILTGFVINPIWIYKTTLQNPMYSITNLVGLEEDIPRAAENIYKLIGDDATVSGAWQKWQADMPFNITPNPDLDSAGYIKIGEEKIYYSSKYPSANVDSLFGIKRKQFNSESGEHPAGSTIFSLLEEAPNNPFTLLKNILNKAGILQYADDKFTEYEQSWTGINFSTKVIVKETKQSKIYFDLVNVLHCISWVGEDGFIKIVKRDERLGNYKKITDKANIISGSGVVDNNENSRFTSWYLYWNRWDLESEITETQAYLFAHNLVDADAEHVNEYGEKIEDSQTTTWLNDDCGTFDEIRDYILSLLGKRKTMARDAQKIYECSLEMKDGDLQTGDLVELSTNDIQDTTGSAYINVLFRAIAKTPQKNKFKIKLIEEK